MFIAAGLGGCSLPPMPHAFGLGSYYTVIDGDTGRVWYTDELKREERGSVEFHDPATGAWVSLRTAEVREISADEFRTGIARPVGER